MSSKCPQCGAALSVSALGDLCPACLLKQGALSDTCAQSEPTPTPGLDEVARLFPQLEIIALSGKGGMGAVYKARQPALDRFVALKILLSQAAGDPGFTARFNREARALARLSHPNIVAVHEFGKVEQASSLPSSEASKTETGKVPVPLHFFIMEYVDGLNLRQLERAGKLSPREALQIVPQICEALQFAHDEGIVHRDIKPENILLDKRGRVKIADFGIAKIMGCEPAVAITETRGAIGTPHYMAPEQVEKPQSVDHRADIFSLGVVLYEMLTGELPLGKFAPPSRKVQVDVRLDEVVLRALEKEPELRYQQARQVKTDVETIASAIPANDRHESKTGRRDDMNRILAGLVIFALVAVIALITAILYRPSRPAGIAVAFTGYSTSSGPVRIFSVQRTPQRTLPILATLPAGSRFAQFSVTNTSKSVFTLYQPYRIEMQIAGSWQELSAGMFDSNRVVAPHSSASFLIPAPTNQHPWRVAVQYIQQGTLRSRLEGGPGSWRLRCTSEAIPPELVQGPSALPSSRPAALQDEGSKDLNHAATAATNQTVDALPPVVVQTQPSSGARDVAPGVVEIRVKFSKEMTDGSWSWTSAWPDSSPEAVGKPRYDDDRRTCLLKVKLEPGRTYAWWLNSEKLRNFKDRHGNPALPYLLICRTSSPRVLPEVR